MIDLRLNELLICAGLPDTGMQQLVQIFNTGYGTVDIGGCYLSNDHRSEKVYDTRGTFSRIARQHLFWADSKPHRVLSINSPLKIRVLILTSSEAILIWSALRTGTHDLSDVRGRRVRTVRIRQYRMGCASRTSKHQAIPGRKVTGDDEGN